MTWFKVDDGFARHRKTKALRRFGARVRSDALALWLLCGAECASAIGQGGIVDGFVTDEDLDDIARPLTGTPLKTACDALVEVGLWLRVDGGYQFHDWADHQPTSESVKTRRERWRRQKSGQRGGSGGASAPPSADVSTVDTAADTPADSAQESAEVSVEVSATIPHARAGTQARARTVPSRPGPTRPDPIRDQGGADLTGESAAPAIDRGAPNPSQGSAESLSIDAQAVADAVAAAIRAAGRAAPPRCTNAADRVWVQLVPFVREEAARSGRTFAVTARALAKGFALDERARSKGYPLPWLAETPGEYLGGHAAPSSFAHVTTSALDRIPEADR